MAKEENKSVSLQDVYDGYAKQATAKDPKIVSLLDKHDIVFTVDFKEIKAGTKLEGISQVVFDYYTQNGVAKEV